MTKTTIALAAAFSGLVAVGNAQAAEISSTLTMKPLHGISFDVASERAVSYFRSENGQCKLVLTLAGEPDWNADTFTATRFEAAVLGGKTTRYVSTHGKAIEFACAIDAETMYVKPVEQMAATGK
jgi:hypothetical protein